MVGLITQYGLALGSVASADTAVHAASAGEAARRTHDRADTGGDRRAKIADVICGRGHDMRA